jgi:hypothetical protein
MIPMGLLIGLLDIETADMKLSVVQVIELHVSVHS